MEHSRFFDSVNGDRVYPASSFSEFFASIIGTGVQSLGTNLQVLEVTGTMRVEIQPGVAWINGYFYMVDADKLQLTIDGADPNDLRYDRIVLRWDLQNRELATKVLKGIPDVNPVIPALTRTESIYEIALAKIEVTAGKSYLEQTQIVDERDDGILCGKASLLVPIDGFDPNDFASAEDLAAKASYEDYAVSILSASWAGSEPYSQVVAVAGIQAEDNPIIDIVMSGTFATDTERVEGWAKVYRAVASADTITFYATEAPVVDLPVQIQVVR